MKNYVVKYYGGGGGHFLQELILWCELQIPKVLTYPNGHAHTVFDKWVGSNIENCTESPEYHTLKPNSPYNFIITHGGNFTSMNTMYQQDIENFQMILIVIDNPFEMALCEYNHFYKNQRHEFKFNGIDYELFPHYKNLMKQRTTNEIMMPDWAAVNTADMAEILIARANEVYKENIVTGLRNSIGYKVLEKIPHVELTVTDIMENSEKVLETISSMVDKPITDTMRLNYSNYITAQKRLRARFTAYDLIKEAYMQGVES